MMQMLGRLMWIGVGAVAVKALEAGLKSGYFDAGTNGNGHASRSPSNGNGATASASGAARRKSRRRTATQTGPH